MPFLLRWARLIGLSLLLTALMSRAHLPAATLLGPMGAAILLALRFPVPQLPGAAPNLAQGLLGLLIAQSLPPEILPQLLTRWPLILGGTLSTLILAMALGWLLSQSRLFPGTTAIWGTMPGAASVITLMSQEFGADPRLVAFMQYLRVVLVTLTAASVARLSGLHGAAEVAWFAPLDLPGLALTLALGSGLGLIGPRIGLPGGAFLLPMLVGLALLHLPPALGLPPPAFSLPPWLMALANAMIGWAVGLRFTPQVLGAALRAFPRVLAAMVSLILACGLVALVLSRLAGLDLLTAYIATSPGGADSIAIIATQVQVDVPFVMTMQMTRFLLILVFGPALARRLSGHRLSGHRLSGQRR